jgi:hypothetical protein
MLHRVLDWALVICIGAVFAMEAVGQASPQTQPVAPTRARHEWLEPRG